MYSLAIESFLESSQSVPPETPREKKYERPAPLLDPDGPSGRTIPPRGKNTTLPDNRA